jgi:hypothetical protein
VAAMMYVQRAQRLKDRAEIGMDCTTPEAAEALKANLNEKLRAFEMTIDDLDGLPYAAPSL